MLYLFCSFNIITVRESTIVRSMDEEKSAIMKPTQEPSVESSLTTHSECNLEENFHQRVLLRDESCCLFCGDCDLTHLKAAHMLRHEDIRPPVLGADNTNELLQQYQLNSLYDTNNGITLCHDCNYAFEGELCCVRVQLNTNGSPTSYKLIVANYLKYLPEFSMKWKPLDGKNIKIPKKKESLKYWPSVVLFQYREGQYIMNWNGQNHTELTTCCRCYTRLKSLSELANHMRANICHKIISSKKLVASATTTTSSNTYIHNNSTTTAKNKIATNTDDTTSNTNNTNKASFKKKKFWFKHKKSKTKINKTVENK